MHVRGEPQPDKLGLCDRRHATKFICLSCSSLTIEADGNKVESRYHPYGQERWSSGTLATEYRFTGQKYEAGVGGLYLMGARWYDPSFWTKVGAGASTAWNAIRSAGEDLLNIVLNAPIMLFPALIVDPTNPYNPASPLYGMKSVQS
jgi:RHS repeat-associated protein